jgi:hypothetical protein
MFEYLDSIQGLLERKCHTTTDDEAVDLGDEVIDQLNLIGNFCASENSQEGTFRTFEGFGKVIEFLLHEETRGTDRKINADHGRMSTMSSSKGIIWIISHEYFEVGILM